MNEKENILQSTSPLLVWNYYRSQLIEQLDHWGYHVISLGFIFLTTGILPGAIRHYIARRTKVSFYLMSSPELGRWMVYQLNTNYEPLGGALVFNFPQA